MVVIESARVSDVSLITAVGRWHEPALAELYRRHAGAVYGLSRRIIRSAAPSEEVTQEVFLDLWRHPERFDASRGTLRAYLLTKTHGKAVDFVRSEVAREQREERTSRETAAAPYDIDREVWDLAVADHVKTALDQLPDELRTPIELAYFGGHSYQAVARILSEPEGTIKSRIRSGLGRLRALLNDLGVEPAGADR